MECCCNILKKLIFNYIIEIYFIYNADVIFIKKVSYEKSHDKILLPMRFLSTENAHGQKRLW